MLLTNTDLLFQISTIIMLVAAIRNEARDFLKKIRVIAKTAGHLHNM